MLGVSRQAVSKWELGEGYVILGCTEHISRLVQESG